MSVPSPVQDFVRGIKSYVRGVQWLRERPSYLALLFVPITIGLIFMVLGLSLFATYDDRILAAVLFTKPAAWYWLAFYYICQLLAYVAVIVAVFLSSLLLMNVIASPIYEIVSAAVEKDLTGIAPPALSIKDQLRVMLVELKKVAAIIFISVVLLLIPGVNVFATVVAAFLVGWDFFDYPLARRGFSFRQRWDLVRGEKFAVLGLGLWLVIPFVQIVMLPLAVAGGTILNIEAMQKRQLLTPHTPTRRDV